MEKNYFERNTKEYVAELNQATFLVLCVRVRRPVANKYKFAGEDLKVELRVGARSAVEHLSSVQQP